MKTKISEKAGLVLKAVKILVKQYGFATLQNIADDVGLNTTDAAKYHVNVLIQKKFLKRNKKTKALEVLK